MQTTTNNNNKLYKNLSATGILQNKAPTMQHCFWATPALP